MLKVVVFDSGWGGELVANYLESELNVVEIVRVIDWHNTPYSGRSRAEIYRLTEQNLKPYIGKVDAIVLGGYAVSLVLAELRRHYPEQKFIGMGVQYERVLSSRNYPDKVVVLMDRLTSESELRTELRQGLPYSTIIIPDCTGWEEKINDNLMTYEGLQAELTWDFILQPKSKPRRRIRKTTQIQQQSALPQSTIADAIRKLDHAAQAVAKDEHSQAADSLSIATESEERVKLTADVVLLLNTHFWGIKTELEDLFGWKVRVLDFREKLLRDVCSALRLRGVDGRRPKL